MRVIADIETNGLEGCTKIWCIVCKDIDTQELHVFKKPSDDTEEADRFRTFSRGVDYWVGHNFLLFDAPVIRRLIPGTRLESASIIDTLVCSRLFDYSIQGGHSLEAWGIRLGKRKIDFNAWDAYSEAMLEYCIQDIEVNYQLYLRFLPYLESSKWSKALRLEHEIALVTEEMHTSGFAFDKPKAEELYLEIQERLKILDQEIHQSFPPRSSLIREITPKATKYNTINKTDFRWLKDTIGTDGIIDLSPYTIGAPFSRISFEPFNLASPKQIVERLNEARWRPIDKTKGHIQAEREQNLEKLEHYKTYGWRISEENLSTLPPDAPEGARKLSERLILESRRSDLEEWLKASVASPVAPGGIQEYRVHGRTNHIGAWTHRLSHYSPNLANIASITKDPVTKEHLLGWAGKYGYEFRSLFRAGKNKVLVGVDAKSVQLRILAHYINDPQFTTAMVSGEEKDGTDPHTLNARALGTPGVTRAIAKTFIYAWLLGAGVSKVANILSCSTREAKRAVDAFISFYPGLKRLKSVDIPRDGSLGYFQGIDGRYVKVDSEYLVLAGYLQNGEATLLKTACLIWQKELDYLGIPYKLVAWPHDEWQTEVSPEHAEQVGIIQCNSIATAGTQLNLRCPMGGNYKIGSNWAQTH